MFDVTTFAFVTIDLQIDFSYDIFKLRKQVAILPYWPPFKSALCNFFIVTGHYTDPTL